MCRAAVETDQHIEPTAPVASAPTSLVAPAMSMPITITYADAKADHTEEELSLDGLSLDGADPWENRVREAADADGESFVTLGPMPGEELASMLLRIREVAHTVACDCTVVHTQERPAAEREGNPVKEGSNNNATREGGSEREGEVPKAQHTAYLVVRKLPSQGHHLDLRVAVVGNVDAGKSTLVGVLTGPTSFLDDGRGLARSRVLRHKHEAETGRTSSIAEEPHTHLERTGLQPRVHVAATSNI